LTGAAGASYPPPLPKPMMVCRAFFGPLVAGLLTASGGAQDRIDLRHEEPLSGGHVTETAAGSITYRTPEGGVRVLAADLVLSVRPDPLPRAWAAAEAALSEGDRRSAVLLLALARVQVGNAPRHRAALRLLAAGLELELGRNEAALASVGRAEAEIEAAGRMALDLRPRASLLRARALDALGHEEESGALLSGLARELAPVAGARRLHAEVLQTWAILAEGAGRPAEAARILADLEQTCGDAAEGADAREFPIRRLRARFERARALASAGDIEGARSLFAALGDSTADAALAGLFASLGEAEIALAQGDPDRALAVAKGLLATRFDAEEGFPEVHLAVLRAHLLRARAGDRRAPEEARSTLALLRERHPLAPASTRAARLIKELQ
jgi:hypothetical protein